VEQYLSEALALRFQLTAHSPFLVDPLRYELGLLGTSPAAQAILQGTYQCPAGVDLYTQQLIAVLQIPPRLTTVSSGIRRDDFIRHWCRSRERTSSSYSSLHYGHYKASVDCPRIAEFHALITDMAFNQGYSLSRWQSSLQVLLEKKPGAIRVANLRALGLLEADFNSAMKILVGHQMVRQALKDNHIPPNATVVSPAAMPFKCPLADAYWQICHASANTP